MMDGIVIVHCTGRGKTVPHPSPFVMKLETYLRMANIPYQVETKQPFGTNGKMPWIEFNGETVSDSQLIIEFLNKKFGKSLSGNSTVEQKAIARSVRIMLEEHFYWGLVHWRFVKSIDCIGDVVNITPLKMKLGKYVLPRKMAKALHAQGLGRQEYETLVRFVSDDLRDVSNLLGKKKFFMGVGEQTTEVDAALFGVLSQAVWGAPGSPYEELINDELINLKDYCGRMRDKYWSDWDNLLEQGP